MIPEVCNAEDQNQCPEILERIRRMNDELTREHLADAALSLTMLKVILLFAAAAAVVAAINYLIKRKGYNR